ncbi:MAG: hypothetical protein LBV39_00595, partial [Bacteroidales bacterium]|nr:hypothetical protein [Bacteroidales bacterium]
MKRKILSVSGLAAFAVVVALNMFAVLLFSCNKKSNIVINIDKFNRQEKLEFKIIKIPPLALSPSNIIISGDKLVLYQMQKDTLFDVFQLPQCNYLFSDGFKGKGPNDFNNVDIRSFCSTPNGFLVFNTGESVLREVIITNNRLLINNNSEKYFNIENRPVNGFK